MYNRSQTIRGARDGYPESGNAQSLIETPQCCIGLALSSETIVWYPYLRGTSQTRLYGHSL